MYDGGSSVEPGGAAMSLALSPMPLMNPRRANTVAPSYHPISSPNRFSPRVKPSPLASSNKGSEKEQTKQTSQRKKNTLISRSGRFMKNQSYGVLSNHRGQFWHCVSGIPQFHSGVCVEQSIILIHTSVSPMVVMLPSLCLT